MCIKLGFFIHWKVVILFTLCVSTPLYCERIYDEDVDYDLYIDYNPHDQIAMEVTSRPLRGNIIQSIKNEISSDLTYFDDI